MAKLLLSAAVGLVLLSPNANAETREELWAKVGDGVKG
jgi:hypothetical protein